MGLKQINVNNTLVTSVDDEPISGSENLVMSDGVKKVFESRKFYILGKASISVSSSGSNYRTFTVGSFTIFDYKGGYRGLDDSSKIIDLYTTKNIYLSSTPDVFTAPDLTIAGHGERLYLVQMNYSVLHNDYLVLGNNGFQFYDPFGLLNGDTVQKAIEETGVLQAVSIINNRVSGLQFAILGDIESITLGSSQSFVLKFKDSILTIFDYAGGYRFIRLSEDKTVILENTKCLYLSESEESFVVPDLSVCGTGQDLYLVQISYSAIHNDYLLALCNGSRFYSPYFRVQSDSSQQVEALTTRFEEKQFYILGKATISLISGSNKRLFNVSSFSLFDYKGGYRFLQQDFSGIEMNSTDNIYLSADPDNFVAPDLSVRGRGERLYLIAKSYANTHNDYLVIGNNGWQYYDPFGLLEEQKIQTIVDEAISHVDVPQNLIKENNGILPSESFDKTPLSFDVFEHILKKDKDVTIIHLGDSISTNNYATGRSDQAYRPPRMDEWGLIPYIEDHLRWRGQQYRRADAKTE